MYNEPQRFTQNKLLKNVFLVVLFHSSCCVERCEPLKYKIYCLKIKYCAATTNKLSIHSTHFTYIIHLEFIYIKFSHSHFPDPSAPPFIKLFSHSKKDGATKIIACDEAAYTRELSSLFYIPGLNG